jgi:hypothetical protein
MTEGAKAEAPSSEHLTVTKIGARADDYDVQTEQVNTQLG